jgi:tripartite-type tricarboxylate transporter receptor subunit TctC
LQSLLAGDLDFVFATVASAAALAREGRVRALAASSAQRISTLPEVPTVAEQGFPGYDQNEWNGLWGPAGLPEEAVQRLHAACRHALADEAVRSRLAAAGTTPLGTSPADFAAFLQRDRAANAALIRSANITLD